MVSASLLLWIVFGVIVSIALTVDLALGNGKHRTQGPSLREGMLWTLLWIALALAFAGGVAWELGRQRALEFVTAYVVELSLSVDNLFVFILIFHYFKIPTAFQPRILKYGIFGAIIMRLLIIFAGVSLLQRFHWIFYVFGALLLVTAIRMLFENNEKMNPESNPLLKGMKRWLPMTTELEEDHFILHRDGRKFITPLFVALVMIEASDLVFAVDSIPAVLAISTHRLIVFSSNIFAILGLRSLFSVISGFMSLFRYLRYGLACVLMFIGAKMLLMDWYSISIGVSLSTVVLLLGLSILASLIIKEKKGIS